MQSSLHDALELAYEKSLRQAGTIYDEERIRQLRLQLLLYGDENDQLHEQLAQGEDRIDEQKRTCRGLQEKLDVAKGSLETVHTDVRLKLREIETLKIELNSLHRVTMDSTKLLTEKLALSRELSSLKPEIDYLRSQAVSHKTVLSERLALQHEVNALQEDLATERQATERAMTEKKKSQVDEARIAKQLETLQAEASKERRERLRIETESQKMLTSWETKSTTLESRLDAFGSKLRTTKDQLKETQAELQAARLVSSVVSNRSITSNTMRITGGCVQKRNASLIDDDTAIGTPGDVQAAKKSKQASAMPGDKSTFSTTPFLNRTASVAPGSPAQRTVYSEAGQSDDGIASENPTRSSKEELPPGLPIQSDSEHRETGQVQRVTTKHIRSDKSKTGKAQTGAPAKRKPLSAPVLKQVVEDTNDAVVGPKATESTGAEAESALGDTTMNLEAKKRRRKLFGGLGKTLFDEDDGEAMKGGRITNGGGEKIIAPGRVTLGGLKAGPRFSGFSPLKKDKKTVAA